MVDPSMLEAMHTTCLRSEKKHCVEQGPFFSMNRSHAQREAETHAAFADTIANLRESGPRPVDAFKCCDKGH